MNVTSFTGLLETAISPMVLISGVGLLLLSATNRLGRAIDRTRMVNALVQDVEKRARRDQMQLEVLFRRCLILQWSIGLLVFSILCSVVMILLLIIITFTAVDLSVGVVGILTINVLSIVGSVLLFLVDISLGLKAIRLELGIE
jgi:hypothetical protein